MTYLKNIATNAEKKRFAKIVLKIVCTVIERYVIGVLLIVITARSIIVINQTQTLSREAFAI